MTYKRFFIAPIKAYQYLSRMLPGSCRYYPTCSEYAAWQFECNAPHRALAASTLRILRCNQLFAGGIDYPVVRFMPPRPTLSPEFNASYGKIPIVYWLVPKDEEKHAYYVIKDFDAVRRDRNALQPA